VPNLACDMRQHDDLPTRRSGRTTSSEYS